MINYNAEILISYIVCFSRGCMVGISDGRLREHYCIYPNRSPGEESPVSRYPSFVDQRTTFAWLLLLSSVVRNWKLAWKCFPSSYIFTRYRRSIRAPLREFKYRQGDIVSRTRLDLSISSPSENRESENRQLTNAPATLRKLFSNLYEFVLLLYPSQLGDIFSVVRTNISKLELDSFRVKINGWVMKVKRRVTRVKTRYTYMNARYLRFSAKSFYSFLTIRVSRKEKKKETKWRKWKRKKHSSENVSLFYSLLHTPLTRYLFLTHVRDSLVI